jgi:hypothetical protein
MYKRSLSTVCNNAVGYDVYNIQQVFLSSGLVDLLEFLRLARNWVPGNPEIETDTRVLVFKRAPVPNPRINAASDVDQVFDQVY